MAGGDPHSSADEALARAERLVREAEAAAERKAPSGVAPDPATTAKVWEAVEALKAVRSVASRTQAERGRRSPLYARVVEALRKGGWWAEARRTAAHLRFDRDPQPRERAGLAEVVKEAGEQLKVGALPKECNLVMKGGITSGVLYPRALATLARQFTFRQIGGASVGGVAAAGVAAAEYSRQHFPNEATNQGFEGLEKMADELGATEPTTGRSKLLSLFQPQVETKPAQDLLLAVLGARTPAGKVLSGLFSMLKAEPLPAIAGLLVGGLLAWEASAQDRSFLVTLAMLGAFASIALGVLGSAVAFGLRAHRAIVANRYGVCAGFSDKERPEALTAWMTGLFDRLAGLSDHPHPLTFGDLWGEDERNKRIELRVMTSNITFGHPYQLPFLEEYEKLPPPAATRPFIPKWFFFKQSDFAELFPDRVCEQMEFHGEQKLQRLMAAPSLDPRWKRALPRFQEEGYLPFPDGRDLPVVVAVRMGLSFPVLLSMVPLYAVDEWQAGDDLRLDRCWFSDGGACSNMPIHFFDTIIPDRPTFAINLLYQEAVSPNDQSQNVWMPSNNTQGLSERWNRIEGRGLMGFLGALLDTMRTWNDSMQMTAPGYRDRIVHIFHTRDEGGLNLTMPPERIRLMGLRGEEAGKRILQDFDWDNHLWVRLRSVLGVSDPELARLREGPLKDPAARALFARLLAEHTGAQVPEDNAPVSGAQATELPALLHLFEELLGAKQQKYDDEAAPNPAPELRVRPRL